eukprot:7705938-Pyramimonas_sp.AAC.1
MDITDGRRVMLKLFKLPPRTFVAQACHRFEGGSFSQRKKPDPATHTLVSPSAANIRLNSFHESRGWHAGGVQIWFPF